MYPMPTDDSPDCGGDALIVFASILERPVTGKALVHPGPDAQPHCRRRGQRVVCMAGTRRRDGSEGSQRRCMDTCVEMECFGHERDVTARHDGLSLPRAFCK